ncbi:MAG: GntR family transcriptional regulator [Paenibacillaceae bacterium]
MPVNLFALSNSISTQVYMKMKKDIIEGTLQPGERLIVLDIAGNFQISQAPVREALERLKQEGLIIGKPNKGSVVSNITAKEIKDIFVLREIIEGFAVRESMPLLTQVDYSYLEEIVSEMDSAVQQNDTLKILELDMSFHGFFYKRCNNDAILELWDHMKTKVMRFMAIANRKHSTKNLVEGHLALINILKAGNVEDAEKRFILHMKSYKMIHID